MKIVEQLLSPFFGVPETSQPATSTPPAVDSNQLLPTHKDSDQLTTIVGGYLGVPTYISALRLKMDEITSSAGNEIESKAPSVQLGIVASALKSLGAEVSVVEEMKESHALSQLTQSLLKLSDRLQNMQKILEQMKAPIAELAQIRSLQEKEPAVDADDDEYVEFHQAVETYLNSKKLAGEVGQIMKVVNFDHVTFREVVLTPPMVVNKRVKDLSIHLKNYFLVLSQKATSEVYLSFSEAMKWDSTLLSSSLAELKGLSDNAGTSKELNLKSVAVSLYDILEVLQNIENPLQWSVGAAKASIIAADKMKPVREDYLDVLNKKSEISVPAGPLRVAIPTSQVREAGGGLEPEDWQFGDGTNLLVKFHGSAGTFPRSSRYKNWNHLVIHFRDVRSVTPRSMAVRNFVTK